MPTAPQFLLPDVGEGLTEAEIVTWFVAPGDTVEINDPLVEVETAKSLVELPSPYSGVITALHASAGDSVAVGSALVSFDDADEPDDSAGQTSSPALESAAVSAAPSDTRPADPLPEPDVAAADGRQSVLVGYGPSHTAIERRPRKSGYRVPGPAQSDPPTAGVPPTSPPVRLRAKNLGIDLAGITPTGAWGQITRADVDAAAADAAPAESVPGQPAETRHPIKGVRRATAAAMVSSAFSAPHVTEWVTVDVTEMLELLDDLRRHREFDGIRLTPLVMVIRAVLSAIRAHPEINSKWDDEANEIVRYRDVNLGIAAATPRGLLVPNIKAAQDMDLPGLCTELANLITDARNGTLTPADMARGTFTITNIGVFGVDGGTPILNPGEAAILCVGQIVRRPWEYRGTVELRSVCTLSMSFDHRLVDGKLGSQVLSHVARLLTTPALALAQ